MLVPAPNQYKMHVLSEVVALGDKCKGVGAGDIVLWQNNGIIERNCRYFMDGVPIFVLFRSDLIARLANKMVKLDNFQVLGEWCLVRRVVKQPNLIVLPEAVQESNQDLVIKFILEQKGAEVTTEVELGDELIVDRTRSNPIKINKESFYYIHQSSVLGVFGS